MSNQNAIDPLEQTREIFAFLQGKIPEGYTIPELEIPKLTADQAWTVIWYLGNLYWEVTDHIERCDVCGDLYDTWRSGETLDYGDGPYSFCDDCINGPDFAQKKNRNPSA
ncbi:MAG: hypothetical protein ABS95_02215 [Verrucomicrobia bacterium SCN 57-15]|nr:MAG: hypothetical protein ABS95_02215 [Verrucomicrobia bacterium SCN 57-15]